MTTELEEQFFKVFGIVPTVYSVWDSKETQIKNFKSFTVYPEITDRVLLKLICCVPKTVLNNCTSIKEIKEAVLKDLILCVRKYTAQELKQQIQQLFKEEE